MSRGVKMAVWVGVFIVCAGVGAFVASRTDPFPPGVEDPGIRRSPSVDPAVVAWAFEVDSTTRHDLHVGGSCRSAWVVRADLTELPDGLVNGEGEAELRGDASCDVPNAQVQATSIAMFVSGTRRGTTIRLTLEERGREPAGSRDVGGFTNTLSEMRFVFEGLGRRATDHVVVERGDGTLGTYVSDSDALIRCTGGC
jgi:hypothetical protein